ncbi:MAG: alpha-L-rhamnosidase, partial [Candidatus Aldehydirespiratoraceae bacterium]
MELQHPSPFSPKWRGRWIWFERPAIHAETATRPVRSDPDGAVGLFRRVVEVDGVPAEAPCRLWVDGRYLLEVNGTEVARGPVRSDPRRAHYDVVDLAPALRPGTNVLSLTVRHFGAATSWWMPAHPTYTLGAGCVAFEAEIGEQWIVSDRSWLAAKGEAWTPVAMPGDVASLPLESFDDRQYPHGWSEGGFDTSEWSSAMEITPMHTGASGERRPSSDPFGMLRPPVRLHFPDGQTHTADMV